MTDEHGLRVDPIRWTSTEFKTVSPRPAHQWQQIVAQTRRKRHPIRVKIAQWLRRWAVRVEP